MPCQDEATNLNLFFTVADGSDANGNDALHLNGRNAVATLCSSFGNELDLSFHQNGIYTILSAVAAGYLKIMNSQEQSMLEWAQWSNSELFLEPKSWSWDWVLRPS